jgi:hypothetical protein
MKQWVRFGLCQLPNLIFFSRFFPILHCAFFVSFLNGIHGTMVNGSLVANAACETKDFKL